MEPPPLNTYSEVMAYLNTTYRSKNRPTLEQSMKKALTNQDNTIGVTYFRSPSHRKNTLPASQENKKPVVSDEKSIATLAEEISTPKEEKKQPDESETLPRQTEITELTIEQINEIKTYPDYWRPTLTEAAKRGESIKETYEELSDFEGLM